MSESDPPRRVRRKKTIGGAPAAASPSPDAELPLSEPDVPVAAPIPDPAPSERDANIKLQLGFFVAVAVGFSTALAGNADQLAWLGFAGPLASIFGFYVFGWAQGLARRSDTRQQFADSCYFLGFLLTMVAMLVGFMPAGLLGQEITSQGILRHFSMALGATALGLVCRILALQSGRSLGQIAAEVETSLTQYARKVSVEAKAIGGELSVLRAELDLQRQQAASLFTTELKDAVEAAIAPIARSVTTISDALATQAAAIATSAKDVQQALGHSSGQLTAATELKAQATEATNAAMVGIGDALQSFERQIASLKQSIGRVVDHASSEIEQMTKALSDATALGPQLAPVMQQAASSVGQASGSLDRLAQDSTRLAERVVEALGDDDRAFGRIQAAEARIVEALDIAGSDARRAIADGGQAASDALVAAGTDARTNIASEAQRFSADVAEATNRLASILNAFSARIEEARR